MCDPSSNLSHQALASSFSGSNIIGPSRKWRSYSRESLRLAPDILVENTAADWNFPCRQRILGLQVSLSFEDVDAGLERDFINRGEER